MSVALQITTSGALLWKTSAEGEKTVSPKMKIAFACHLLAIFIIAAFGLTYLLRSEFMPYHGAAVGMPWAEVSAPFQVLILALMRAVGGACIAVVVLALFVLLVPFRRGAKWARWALPAGGLVIAAGALYAMLFVALNTTAKPPWIGPAAGALLVLVGLAFSLGDRHGIARDR
jgi:hypothetical protein